MRRWPAASSGPCTVLLAAALVAGCGGGTAQLSPPSSAASRVVQGAAMKGPLVGATIQFFHLDSAGNPLGAALASAVTDAQGHVSTALPSSSEPLLAVSSGGSYLDESDDTPGPGRRHIVLGAGEGFEAVVPANASTFCLTPYSMAVLLRARRVASGANFPAVYAAAVAQAQTVFGFDPTSVIPGDPLAPDLGNVPAAQYALLLGGAAYAINAIAVKLGVQPDYAIVRSFIEDLSDGRLDGKLGGQPVEVKAAMPSDVSLNDEILRFRNNHFDLYNGLPLPVIDENLWSQLLTIPAGLPPLALPDAINVLEGGMASTLAGGAASVLANDSDTYGGTLTAILVAAPAHGTLTLNPDGTFAYVHDGSETTGDSFTYKASNGSTDSAPATVTITVTLVNDAPVAAPDAYSTNEDTPLTVAVPGVLANDSDEEGDPLSAVLFSGPAHGVLQLNSDGSFHYTPFANFNGIDQFKYQASDGKLKSAATAVTITVNPVNDPPVAQGDFYSMSENTTLTVFAPGVLQNDYDVDGNPLTAILDTPPATGVLSLNPNGGFSYTPPAGFVGVASFTYHASDGIASSATVQVNIFVRRPNQPPTANDDFYFFAPPSVLSVNAPGVLSNDSDPDGDALTAVLVTPPAYGTVQLNPDGSFTYTPGQSFTSSDQFTYVASDGQAQSNIATVQISTNFCAGFCTFN